MQKRLFLTLSGLALAAAFGAAMAATTMTVSSDAKTVTYKIDYDSAATPSRRVFIDADSSPQTGYKNGESSAIGAEYAIFNDKLMRYVGTGGWNWAWQEVGPVSFSDNGRLVSWTVPRDGLGLGQLLPIKSLDAVGSIGGVGTVKGTHYLSDGAPVALSRDPLKWPFATNSIWNMPIGSSAVYVPAKLPVVPGDDVWSPMPQVDDEIIVLAPDAPPASVYLSDAGWTGKDRCQVTGGLLLEVPVPLGYIMPHNNKNNSATFLSSDRRTLWQAQPFTRCQADGPATSLVKFPPVDIYGDGQRGAHGGSGLSAFGGTLRLGELRPGGTPPRHALKIDVYAKQALYRCTAKQDCFRWPAVGADAYAVGHYGTFPESQAHAGLKMGALLAIPAGQSVDALNLETEPGKMLAWTLQNYGAYIVDDTWGASFALTAETGPNGSFRDQFKADWGFPLEQRVRDNTPWTRDLQRIIGVLALIDNNSPISIGGGGAPLQPLAPALP